MRLTGVQWPEMIIKRAFAIFVMLGFSWAAMPVRAASKPVSDDVVYNNVIRKLATDDTVKGGALTVDVKGGAVILQGVVDSERKKQRAEKIAKKVAGVKSIDNQIKVVLK